MTVNPKNFARLFGIGQTRNGSVYLPVLHKSVNSGSSWTPQGTGDFPSGLKSPAVDPVRNNRIFAGTQGGSAFKHTELNRRELTLAASTGGTTQPAPGTHFYSPGESVTIRAIPDSHFLFSGWSGDLSGTHNPAVLVMNTDKSVTANFVRRIYAPLKPIPITMPSPREPTSFVSITMDMYPLEESLNITNAQPVRRTLRKLETTAKSAVS